MKRILNQPEFSFGKIFAEMLFDQATYPSHYVIGQRIVSNVTFA